MNLFIFISIILALTLVLGSFIEKIRVPWVFSALFLGLFLSLKNPFPEITDSSSFTLLSDLGMYFLLFIIGLELDIKEICKQGKFISKLSFSLILAESLFGSFFIHYLFDVSWGISILVASSFATVGEAILIPILDEFKLIKTKFGQILLGVGTLDDLAELVTIIIASIILGRSVGDSNFSILGNFLLLSLLFLIPLFLQIFSTKINHLEFKKVPALFLFGLIVLFAFVGVGSFVEASSLGAILAGIALKNLLLKYELDEFESIIRIVAYGFFVPIFFLSVGLEVDLIYLFSAPLLVILLLLITKLTKISISYFFARKKIGIKKSVLLGIGLSAKFSTSIVIITMLYNQGIIPLDLYSVLIGAMIASKFIIPVAFSLLLKKWNLEFQET
ncbi:MAG: cation:proton antiporter [Candidatus Peregrinibacteria bacterium]|nr:cation:proton antiporter [Candidatus Peregrinibacteria bacterium]